MLAMKIILILLLIYFGGQALLGCCFHFGIIHCHEPEPLPVKNLIITMSFGILYVLLF